MEQPPSYFERSRTPIHSLILVAPFLLAYEIGTLALAVSNPEFKTRNGVDVMFHAVLAKLGISGLFIGVLVLAAGWAIWQARDGSSLAFDVKTVALMFVESVVLGLTLYIVPWQIQWYVYEYFSESAVAAVSVAATVGGSDGLAASVVLSCGAGVYEEFLFRVLLVSAIAAFCLKVLGMEAFRAGVVAVLGGALLFSAAHYIPPYGDAIRPGSEVFWIGFLFRVFAGVFFAAIYQFRCFGVAVAAHALYDILVSVDHAMRT